MIAESRHWKHLPFGETIPVAYTAAFGPAEVERLRQGLIPQAMEDKWFVYFEEPCLHFHRSWTGQAVYRVDLAPSPDGGRHVAQALRASDALPDADPAYQAALLDFLIRNLLLGEARPFPRPAGRAEKPAGVYQHAIAGTGYPEQIVGRKRWWRFWR